MADLTLKQARDLALKALASAEERRQLEREAEAKYWADEAGVSELEI